MKTLIGTDIARAAMALRAGRLVGIPTETVYGLAANALDTAAVAGIFAAKQRPSFDPLIVHIARMSELEKYAMRISAEAYRLAAACWPGPLTLVLPKQPIVPDLVTAGLDTVAIRLPGHELTRQLLSQLDFPLAAPSANPFGYISPTRPEHVAEQLGRAVDYILDGGPCQIGIESTIVSFAGTEPLLLRAGGYAREELEEMLGRPLAARTHSDSRPAAPGMLSRHYSPRTRLQIVDPHELPSRPREALAYLAFRADRQSAPDWAAGRYALSDSGDLRQAASRLFAILRILDQRDYQHIWVEPAPELGLGIAINDRLRRAAAH